MVTWLAIVFLFGGSSRGDVLPLLLRPVSLLGKLTVIRMGAVATAGSTTEFAKLNEVLIFRTVDGERYAAWYNMVGDLTGRWLFKDSMQTTLTLITSAVYALDSLRQ